MSAMLIRAARPDDADAVWSIIGPTITSGDAYTLAVWATHDRTEGHVVAHGLADAMAEEPRGLVLNLWDAADLVSRDALLRRAHGVRGLKAFVERDADPDRSAELALAVTATIEAALTLVIRPGQPHFAHTGPSRQMMLSRKAKAAASS